MTPIRIRCTGPDGRTTTLSIAVAGETAMLFVPGYGRLQLDDRATIAALSALGACYHAMTR